MSRFAYKDVLPDYSKAFESLRSYVEPKYFRYIERYIKFITSRAQLNKTRKLGKSERHDHHVLPVSWGGQTEHNNMIPLTFKEHIIAHHILYYTNNPPMVAAYYSMANIGAKSDIRYNITADQYQVLQEKMYSVKSANSKRNMTNPEIRAKISASLKGKCAGEKASSKRAVINCDTGEIFATARMADDHYGWRRGAVTDGLHDKHLTRGYRFEYYDVYVANGNKPTPFPVYVNHMKGKKHTEEQKRKISESLKALHRIPVNRRPIKNLTTGETFESVTKAAKTHNLKTGDLLSSLWHNKQKGKIIAYCKGYQWCYVDNLHLIKS